MQQIHEITFNEKLFSFITKLTNKKDLIIINNFPISNNKKLLELASVIGRPIREGINFQSNPLEDDFIYRIEASKNGLTDDENHLVYSTMSIEFPCHTDGFSSKVAPDFILLLCIKKSMIGGKSLFITVSDIIKHLSSDTICKLKESVYPSLNTIGPILYENSIRYNPYEIERVLELDNFSLFDSYKKALLELDNIIQLHHKMIELQPKQCLIINNSKVLHGRTSFFRFN